MNYSLFQPRVLDYLRNGPPSDAQPAADKAEWFRLTIAETFCEIADHFKCDVHMAKRRLDEARGLWISDIDKTRIDEGGVPDHFKQAGFLAYWLRRRIVIAVNKEIPGVDGGSRQQDFLHYGNEICSFLTGFRICLFFEANKQSGEARIEELSRIRVEYSFLKDCAVLLHHKNVSPHALYLIYRSMFYRLYLPTAENRGGVVILPPPG